MNSKAIALLEEFAETQDDLIKIDGNILFRCKKKHFPMIYPRLANMGCLISEIETLEPTSEYMSVRLYNAYKN